jgi:hypothetical protein
MLHEDDQWGPHPTADATKSECETSEDAALSRLRPIQDGDDQWEEHRSRWPRARAGAGNVRTYQGGALNRPAMPMSGAGHQTRP